MLPGQSRYSAWPGHGLPSASEAMSPALTKRQRERLLKKEKAIKHREDATGRQTERAREQKQKQTEKNLDADFQLDGKSLPGSGWEALGDPGARAIQVV
jgi:ribosomal protein L2